MHSFTLFYLIFSCALGASLGFLGGLFGIGGGIIAIPLLVLFFGMEQSLAQGTVLVMMVPNLMIAWWRYSQKHPIPFKTAFQIGLIASFVTFLVAQVATHLDQQISHIIFSIFLLLVAVSMLLQKRDVQTQDRKSRINPRLMPLVGIVGGGTMGLLGVGGGLVSTPIFAKLFGQKQASAQGLSLALVTPSSLIALLTYGHAHLIDWSMGLPLAFSGLFTVSAGVTLAHRLPEHQMRVAFAMMILLTASWLLVRPYVM